MDEREEINVEKLENGFIFSLDQQEGSLKGPWCECPHCGVQDTLGNGVLETRKCCRNRRPLLRLVRVYRIPPWLYIRGDA